MLQRAMSAAVKKTGSPEVLLFIAANTPYAVQEKMEEQLKLPKRTIEARLRELEKVRLIASYSDTYRPEVDKPRREVTVYRMTHIGATIVAYSLTEAERISQPKPI